MDPTRIRLQLYQYTAWINLPLLTFTKRARLRARLRKHLASWRTNPAHNATQTSPPTPQN